MKNAKINLLFLSLLTVFSCSKETDFLDEQETLSKTNSNQIELIDFGISNESGKQHKSSDASFNTSGRMLSFPSVEAYEETIELLEEAVEVHQDEFYSQFEGLDMEEDKLDDLIDSLNFNDYQPLVDFENEHDFRNSMRKKMQVLIDEWLNNEELDPETDPENDNVFSIYDQALHNEMGEIMIGNKVLSLDKPDYNYEIVGDYANSLEKINNGEDVSDDPNIEIYEKMTSSTCLTWKRQKDTHKFESSRKVRRIVQVRSYWGGSIIVTTAKIVSLRRKSFLWTTHWARSQSIPIGVHNKTSYNTSGCERVPGGGHDSYEPPKKRKSRIARVRVNPGGPVYTIEKNHGLKGTFYYKDYVTTKYLN